MQYPDLLWNFYVTNKAAIVYLGITNQALITASLVIAVALKNAVFAAVGAVADLHQFNVCQLSADCRQHNSVVVRFQNNFYGQTIPVVNSRKFGSSVVRHNL